MGRLNSEYVVSRFIRGTPYSRSKTTGRLSGPDEWSATVKEQTHRLRPIKGPCRLEVSFILPADRFPFVHSCGNDLDNLLKRLLDALAESVLREAPGRDAAIVQLSAEKRKALKNEPTGARIRFTKPDARRRLYGPERRPSG
jgi:Holliday junction resolvase RusA-like endonuclease